MSLISRIIRRPVEAPAVRVEPVAPAVPTVVPATAMAGTVSTMDPGWFGSQSWGTSSRVKSLPPVSPDLAQKHATVMACCSVVAGDLAKLPLEVYQVTPEGRENRITGHPVHQILNVESSPNVPAIVARFGLAYQFLLQGRAYAWAPKDAAGHPILLDLVTNPGETEMGRDRVYGFTDGAKVARQANARTMVHLRYMALDGWTGRSPIQVAAESVGLALAGQEAAARAASGTQMRAFLKLEENYGSDEDYIRNAKRVRAALDDPEHNGIPIVRTTEDIQSLQLSSADLQLLESRKFDREQLAALYRVPPSKLQMLEHGVKANGQQQAIDYKTDCLLHWAGFLESGLGQGLFTASERAAGFVLRHNYDALLAATTKELYEAIRMAVGGPWAHWVEGRDMAGLPPMPKGLTPYPPPNMTQKEPAQNE